MSPKIFAIMRLLVVLLLVCVLAAFAFGNSESEETRSNTTSLAADLSPSGTLKEARSATLAANVEGWPSAALTPIVTPPPSLVIRDDDSTSTKESSLTNDIDSRLDGIESQLSGIVDSLGRDGVQSSHTDSLFSGHSGLMKYISEELLESDMELARVPRLASDPTDPLEVYCDFYTNKSGSYGQSIPRCYMEDAINDFCNVSEDAMVGLSTPDRTDLKGGRWTTYHFANYTNASLYIGLEIDQTHDRCKKHVRVIGAYEPQLDNHCKDRLMGEIVDRCT